MMLLSWKLRLSRMSAYLLFCLDDASQELIFQTLAGDSEINNRGTGIDLGAVDRVGQLCCDVQRKAFTNIDFLVSDLHLQTATGFEEVLVQNVIQSRV